MQWWRLALDYLKVLVWPALWMTLALLFRSSIRAFLDRLRSFEGVGLHLSAVEGAEIAELKVSSALSDSDSEVRQAVDRAFDETRVTLLALDEPWVLEHFNGDAYTLINRTGATTYDVEIETGDFIVRGELLFSRVGSGQRIKLFLLRSMATASDSIIIKWANTPGATARQHLDILVPPRPKR